MKKKHLIVLILLFVRFSGHAFGQQTIFNKLQPPNGSGFSTVMGFAQDANGSVWIGTNSNGMYIYNGLQINNLMSNPLNPNSLANNFAHSVCTDKKGLIWIGTFGSGLDILNPETGNFTHMNHDINDPTSLANDTVTALLLDKEGIMWIGTHGGLDKFDPETNTFVHYKHNANDSTTLSNNQVRTMYEDSNGTLWFGTGSPWLQDGGTPETGGLNKLNRETGTFTRYMHDPDDNQSLINNKVTAIFEDNKGTLWIGTWKKGIQKMNREKGTFDLAFSESDLPEIHKQRDVSTTGLTHDYISFIIQDVAGKIWIGTLVSGIYIYNPSNKKNTYLYSSENSSTGFSSVGGRTAFNTRDGILWIGARDGSIYYVDPSVKQIEHTSGPSTGSFYEEPNGDFWIGTHSEIIRTIKNSGVTKQYKTDDYNSNAQNNLGYIVYGDREGNIWVGTTESLNLFDRKTEKFIAYKHDPENSNSISANYAITFYEDSKSNFWIGTANGLNLMDRKTGRFERFYAHPESSIELVRNVITSIVEDNSGKLWIGNYFSMGVNHFNPETGEFKSYLKNTSISMVYIDTDGVLWAGATNGLYKYNPDMDNFTPFTPNGSIAGISAVMSIVEDNEKNLWLTTGSEIVKINQERNEISFFGKYYGISQKTFNYLAGFKKNNGEIYFGDYTGYFSFFPEEILKNLQAPEIIFTAFRLLDKKLIPGDGGPLTTDLNTQKVIQLPYNQNVFSIDFAMVDYANPEQNHLWYYLENFDIDWHNANAEHKAYYFNVPPGKYIFHIKGVNSYGAWGEKEMVITINPPWYKTWLAYGIYTLLIIVIVYTFDRVMRRRIIQKERLKTQERELAQAKEIEKAYHKLKETQSQLIQSEKMASLGELTAGIAHEIQNPLNFVNNFSEVNRELIDELKDAVASQNQEEIQEILMALIENEDKVINHGKRADSIVKSMLQHSRTSSGEKELTDINALCDEYLRLAYHGMRAKDKSFNANFKTNLDTNLPKINVVPQDIGRVLLNLINNAFQAVAESLKIKAETNDYKPVVEISTKYVPIREGLPAGQAGVQGEDILKISVKDNGQGIPEDIKDKIFQPFFTTKPTGQGTGLGLSLSYDIVKAHGGEIKVESNKSKGTTFILNLPVT